MIRFLRSPLSLLLLIAIAPVAGAADEIDRLVQQGIEQLYSVQFDAAAASFDQAIKADPSDPRGHFYRANVHLWSYLFARQQAQSLLYFNASDRVIKVAEARLKSNPGDHRSRMFLGMTYGYRAIANARAENLMSAALSAKTCYDQLTTVAKADPKLADAQLGLGIFHFVFGSVPKAAGVLAGLGGVKGDAQLGLREIENAAARGFYFRNDAKLILALLNIYYRDDFKAGEKTLSEMARKYPKNVAILYALGNVYLDQEQPEQAVIYLDKVTQLGNIDFRTINDFSYQRCGMAFFTQNNFPRAKTYLQKFLRRSDEKILKAYAWYLLGVCFEMEGARSDAVAAYQRALKSPNYGTPEDIVGHRRAKMLIATPLTPNDMEAIRALNNATASKFDGAITTANALLSRHDATPAQRAQAHYAVGQGLQGKKQYAKAIESYRSAASVGKHPETWVTPFSFLHIAQCYLKLNDRTNWQKNLETAKTFHGYDNEKILRFQIERDVTMID
ncbi:MAG: DUF3808 domain-containing protein [Armatimonadetes bacterium]|nr:DUF3808 domain-containing protein [Armatimonadota bacterium]